MTELSEQTNEHLELANKYRQLELWDEAIREYKKAILLEPANALIHLNLSHVYEKKATKDQNEAFYTLALDEAREALKYDFTNKDIHNQLIVLYDKKNILDEALSVYQKWSVQYPDNKFLQDCLKRITTIIQIKIPVPETVTVNRGRIWEYIFIAMIILEFLLGLFQNSIHLIIGSIIFFVYIIVRFLIYRQKAKPSKW